MKHESHHPRGPYWTISSLITKLEEIKAERGDLVVFGDDNRDIGEDTPTPEELVINIDEDGVILGVISHYF